MSTVEQRMESEARKWLRKHYHPALSDGPAAKNSNFSDIQQQLTSEFPNKTFNQINVSAAIKSVFPGTLVGKSTQSTFLDSLKQTIHSLWMKNNS